MIWQIGQFNLDLRQPRVMGIVNVTPDSFSDGGRLAGVGAAVAHCEWLVEQGADILDLGGESSRPGAQPVPLDEELARVMPVLREAVKLGVPVSIDTYKPALMRAALDAGASCINDIWALRQTDSTGSAEDAVAAHPSCGVALMHMHREPLTMQTAPMSGDVVPQVMDFLRARVDALQSRGVGAQRIALDVGTGFGKTPDQNFALLARHAEFEALGHPLLAGWSRKSSLGAITGLETADRLAPSVAAALIAVQRGARIVRVHDVRETVAALKVWAAVQRSIQTL